jgi:EpsI family protein
MGRTSRALRRRIVSCLEFPSSFGEMKMQSRRSVVLAAMMGLASAGSIAARPRPPERDPFDFDKEVPKAFGDWRMVVPLVPQVVNQRTKTKTEEIYSQIVERTYGNAAGYGVMLSLAYGEEQRGGLIAHPPEICYPAQGFDLLSKNDSVMATPFGKIAGRRLDTRMGSRREPVTYWFNVAGKTILTPIERRWLEIQLGIFGRVPDGLLFRVSSIDDQTGRAYAMQDRFVVDLLQSVDPKVRKRLAGQEMA